MRLVEPTIWRVPAYLPYLQPPLVSAVIQDAEVKLGVRLPQAYLDLLHEQNGGYLRLTLPDMLSEMIWGIGPHFPTITGDFYWKDQTLTAEEGWSPHNAKLLVPFDGDGHWHMCFDYRVDGPNAEPKITYIDLEGEQENDVAEDFATFLTMLREHYVNAAFGVRSDMAKVLRALERELGITFKSQGDFDHGYEVMRASVDRDGRSHWLWISPNEVTRAFVRPSDARYKELAGLLPGTALRMPTHPEAVTVIECGGPVAAAVMDACLRSSLASARDPPALPGRQ